MGCYSTILVAIDGSPDASAALEHAAKLARDQHACLVVMTAAPPPVLFCGIGSGATVVANLESNFAHELREAVRSLPSDIGVQSRVAHGPAAKCILEVAEECRCDLIVMGFHGHGRLHHALRGSVSDTVARESRRPVLLVRADCAAADRAAADRAAADTPPGGIVSVLAAPGQRQETEAESARAAVAEDAAEEPQSAPTRAPRPR
jgi:nucleotide-binding universal stress UspA family protein